MYNPQQVSSPISAVALALLAAAKDRKLVLCVGAGVSVAQDASLPSGPRLGELLHERLRGRLQGYVAPENVQDLIAVADAAVVPFGGLEALQAEVVELAPFIAATPNYGHQALGMLLVEGALTVLTWNWDSCIERSTPQGEMLDVARTTADMANLPRPQLAKVHGCATMRRTLLLTSEQLATPPVWTDQAFAERIRGSTMVFVGIGDVADYAQKRIRDLIAEFNPPDVCLVSRNIRTSWAESVWAEVLPDLPEERRIQGTADGFLDDLARAWARELLERVRGDCAGLRENVRPGVERVIEAIGRLSPVQAIRWCRSALVRPTAGDSAVRAPSAGDAVMAVGVLASRTEGDVTMPRPACCKIGDDDVELLVTRDRTVASDVHREARRRSEQLASNGQLATDKVTFVVSGTIMGRLDESAEGATDIVAERDPSDVIDGPGAVRPTYLRASILLEEAA